jgi:hypothetical protein
MITSSQNIFLPGGNFFLTLKENRKKKNLQAFIMIRHHAQTTLAFFLKTTLTIKKI